MNNGTWRPFERDGLPHDCPNRPAVKKVDEQEPVVRTETDLLAKQVGRLAYAIEELVVVLKEKHGS